MNFYLLAKYKYFKLTLVCIFQFLFQDFVTAEMDMISRTLGDIISTHVPLKLSFNYMDRS